MSIFAQVLDIAINNTWLLHRRDCSQIAEEKLPLKKFRVCIALALMKTNTKSECNKTATDSPRLATITKPFVARPVAEARLDCFDHFPIFTSQGRCRLCKNGKTMVMYT